MYIVAQTVLPGDRLRLCPVATLLCPLTMLSCNDQQVPVDSLFLNRSYGFGTQYRAFSAFSFLKLHDQKDNSFYHMTHISHCKHMSAFCHSSSRDDCNDILIVLMIWRNS